MAKKNPAKVKAKSKTANNATPKNDIAAIEDRPFPFLKLPVELRFMIYDLTHPDSVENMPDNIENQFWRGPKLVDTSFGYPPKIHLLAQISRQLRKEVLGHLYGDLALYIELEYGVKWFEEFYQARVPFVREFIISHNRKSGLSIQLAKGKQEKIWDVTLRTRDGKRLVLDAELEDGLQGVLQDGVKRGEDGSAFMTLDGLLKAMKAFEERSQTLD